MILLAVSSLPAFAEDLTEGARGEDVERFQQRLADLGYLSGGVDGIYGKQTTEAVSLFQTFNGMTVTGEADEDTQAAVFSAQAVELPETLERDDEGEDVQRLQERLVFLGFLDDEADGKYGKNTENAVEDYQEHLIAQGVEQVSATGTATGVTQFYLFDEERSTYIKDLRQGDEDGEVRRLERRLQTLGYLDDVPDEYFDEYTDSVVRAFQDAAGLDVTGVIDEATVDALFASDAPVAERFVAHDVHSGDTGDAVLAVQKSLA